MDPKYALTILICVISIAINTCNVLRVKADDMPPLLLELRLPLVIKEQTPIEFPPCECPIDSKTCVC